MKRATRIALAMLLVVPAALILLSYDLTLFGIIQFGLGERVGSVRPVGATLIVFCIVTIPTVICLRWAFRRDPPQLQLSCRHCGYDLCATPDRCPECGVVPAGAKA